MVTLVQCPGYTGPERRRRAHISDSQFGEIVEHVHDSERIRRIDRRISAIDESLGRGDERMTAMSTTLDTTRAELEQTRAELAGNTATTQAIAADTAEIRELVSMGRLFFRAADRMAGAARWVGTLAAAGLAIWGAVYAVLHGRPWK